MQHERLAVFARQSVNNLFVLIRSQRGDNQRLCFTAGEQSGTVRARQNADFGRNRTDRFRIAAVNAHACFQNRVAHRMIFHFVEYASGNGRFGFVVGNADLCGFADIGNGVLTFQLIRNFISFAQFGAVSVHKFIINNLVFRRGNRHRPGFFARFGLQAVDHVDHRLHFFMAKHDGAQHDFFG